MMLAVEQVRTRVRAAADGYSGLLCIALSDGINQPRLSSLLARCREEVPEVEIRLSEVSLAQQLKGLRDGLYDAGFGKVENPGGGLTATLAWSDPIVVAVPPRHPLLAYPELPLSEVLRYPLVLCDPDACEGCSRQFDQLLREEAGEPKVAEHVSTHDLMLTLVAAGYGLGLSTESQLVQYRQREVVARPLAGESRMLKTYLLRRDGELSGALAGFVGRVMTLA